jgi:hypothetical protein
MDPTRVNDGWVVPSAGWPSIQHDEVLSANDIMDALDLAGENYDQAIAGLAASTTESGAPPDVATPEVPGP